MSRTGSTLPDAAEDVIAVIRGGARGYVTKAITGEELCEAIRRVHAGTRLSISARTVEFHAAAILRKLRLSSRQELTRWAAGRRLG